MTLSACGPRRPDANPNSTFWLALRSSTPPAGRAARDVPPPPPEEANPLSASYHFTLPVGTRFTPPFRETAMGKDNEASRRAGRSGKAYLAEAIEVSPLRL